MSEIDRAHRVKSSMLWSAWADALGWISELTSEANLRRRTKGRALTQPWEWSRQVGGRVGVRVDLPAGCYSDDTQLRLATSRSISGHGFDVEAFARVELPVWQSYALGAGRASKSAASGMTRQSATWSTNFYPDWHQSGGNGAAMRIQPHVYAARNARTHEHLDDVIRNAVVTHGHPRAIVGAVLHAVALTHALENGRPIASDDFGRLLDVTRDAFIAFARLPELAAYWRPRWEDAASMSLEDAWGRTVDEISVLLDRAFAGFAQLRNAGRDRNIAEEAYEQVVKALRLDDERYRGSGSTTALAALLLASALPDHPAQAAQLAASRLNTDTDTIGTMAAAIVGAIVPRPLISEVQDQTYIEFEANRLGLIADNQDAPHFRYPDLLHWSPPKSGLDGLGVVDGRLALAGLSYVEPIDDNVYTTRESRWRWVVTEFGATMLVKHRHELREMDHSNRPIDADFAVRNSHSGLGKRRTDEPPVHPTLFDAEGAQGWAAIYGESGVGGIVDVLAGLGFADAENGSALNWLLENADRTAVEQFGARLHAARRGEPGQR